MKTESRKLELRLKVLWPFITFSILWSTFSLWICIRENELLWSILLIAIGLIPLLWEIFISPNIKETEYNTKTKQSPGKEQLPIGEKSILSSVGRIRRTTYWTRALIVAGINFVFRRMQENYSHDIGVLWITGIIGLILTIFIIIQAVKRMHDVDKSGWYILIPIYNLILAFTEGTKGDNKYGGDPKSK